jgi:hypothetical protein
MGDDGAVGGSRAIRDRYRGMQAINERLRRVLSLDFFRRIAVASKDLLRRAGLEAEEE